MKPMRLVCDKYKSKRCTVQGTLVWLNREAMHSDSHLTTGYAVDGVERVGKLFGIFGGKEVTLGNGTTLQEVLRELKRLEEMLTVNFVRRI